MIASIPAIASFPKIADAAAVCSVSDNPPKLLRKLSNTPFSDFEFPALSNKLMLYLSIAIAIVSVGDAIFTRAVFKAVPDILPFTLALAIKPSAKDVSSTEYFKAPATGAMYLKDSPNMLTFVFAFALACANTSAK